MMDETDLKGLAAALEDLPDPRSARNQGHALLSIVMIAICGAILHVSSAMAF